MNNEETGRRIKALIAYSNIKRNDLAKELGISYNTLTKKLKGKKEFTIPEIIKMRKIFNIDKLEYGKVIFYIKN